MSKKIIISGLAPFLILIFMTVLYSQSDTLEVVDATGTPGSTGNKVPINLVSTDGVAGLQFNITDTPDELTFTAANTTSRTSAFTAGVNDHGTYATVVLVSLTGDTIAAGTGTIIELLCDVDASSATGTSISMELSDVAVSDPAAQSILVIEVDGNFDVGTTSVEKDSKLLAPADFNLFQNYPNPFNPNTIIEYQCPEACHVKISIYNIAGQEIVTLVDQQHNIGKFKTSWNGKDKHNTAVAAGLYFCQIHTEAFNKVVKLALVR